MYCSFYILGKIIKETLQIMIHVKKNIRDSFQFVLFFFFGGGGELQMTFKKIKTAVWIGVNYVANNIISQ